MFTDCHLILFTRYPNPGKTKTRLIPALGPQKAAELQRKMTERATVNILKLKEKHGNSTTVYYTDTTEKKMSTWLGNSFDYHLQGEGDIGLRMKNAFTRTFHHNFKSAILMGSDIPQITTNIIEEAIISLETKDAVFGPSRDGGYYLIGMRAEHATQLINSLFKEVPWSTDDVLRTSMRRLARTEHSYSLLQPLHDIDRPEDLYIAEALNLL